MAVMLQIPWVFPCVSRLESAKAVQCPRPGPNIGYKTQQIPRYSPVCPMGQPLGWPLISALYWTLSTSNQINSSFQPAKYACQLLHPNH